MNLAVRKKKHIVLAIGLAGDISLFSQVVYCLR